MKKTILAVAIAAVSFGATANTITDAVVEANGNVVINGTDMGYIDLDTGDIVFSPEFQHDRSGETVGSINADKLGSDRYAVRNNDGQIVGVVGVDKDGNLSKEWVRTSDLPQPEITPPVGEGHGVSVDRNLSSGLGNSVTVNVHDQEIGTIRTTINPENGARTLDIQDENGSNVVAVSRLDDDVIITDRTGDVRETTVQEIKGNLNGKTRPESGGDRPELDIPNKDEIDWDNGKDRPAPDSREIVERIHDRIDSTEGSIVDVNQRLDAARETVEEAAPVLREPVEQARETYAQDIDRLDGRIDSLEQDLYKQGQKMLELDDRMDQVMASSHAITNARPVLANAGEYAVGVGVGFAGSTEAVALGGAYQVNDSWSVSGTMNYATSTSHASSDFSAGVGAHYRFGN